VANQDIYNVANTVWEEIGEGSLMSEEDSEMSKMKILFACK